MKTISYNPSASEVDFAKTLHIVREHMGRPLTNNQITHVENYLDKDNPMIKCSVADTHGDPHEMVVRIIQIPDTF